MALSSLVLETLPRVERLSSRVIRVLGLNPGLMTLQGTNTYIVGTGRERVLIDAGDSDKPDYVSLLKETLAEANACIRHIVVTHWHGDHLGGVEGVWNLKGDLPMTVSKFPRPVGKVDPADSLPFPYEKLHNGQVITAEGATLRVVATPGHTDDHVCLLFEEEHTLFSGDCILGQGTTVFEDLKDYMSSLERLLKLEPKLIYPGHGPVVREPLVTIKGYIDHRNQRERQIMAVLESAASPLAAKDIVAVIYKDVPENLWMAATENVLHHLSKLHKEGRVEMAFKSDDGAHRSQWKLRSNL